MFGLNKNGPTTSSNGNQKNTVNEWEWTRMTMTDPLTIKGVSPNCMFHPNKYGFQVGQVNWTCERFWSKVLLNAHRHSALQQRRRQLRNHHHDQGHTPLRRRSQLGTHAPHSTNLSIMSYWFANTETTGHLQKFVWDRRRILSFRWANMFHEVRKLDVSWALCWTFCLILTMNPPFSQIRRIHGTWQDFDFLRYSIWSFLMQIDLRHIKEKENDPVIEVGMDLSAFYLSVEWDLMAAPAKRKVIFYRFVQRKSFRAKLILICIGSVAVRSRTSILLSTWHCDAKHCSTQSTWSSHALPFHFFPFWYSTCHRTVEKRSSSRWLFEQNAKPNRLCRWVCPSWSCSRWWCSSCFWLKSFHRLAWKCLCWAGTCCSQWFWSPCPVWLLLLCSMLATVRRRPIAWLHGCAKCSSTLCPSTCACNGPKSTTTMTTMKVLTSVNTPTIILCLKLANTTEVSTHSIRVTWYSGPARAVDACSCNTDSTRSRTVTAVTSENCCRHRTARTLSLTSNQSCIAWPLASNSFRNIRKIWTNIYR